MEPAQAAPVAPAAPAPQPAPAAPPVEDRIKGFAQEMLKDFAENTDPDDPEGSKAAPEGEKPAEEMPAVEEAEKATTETAEVPMVEVELEDGVKVQVPESVKAHLMRDKDYRQKTMALAEQRKGFEQLTAMAQQVATQAQQMAPYHAQLYAMDSRAEQLGKALQSQELAQDPIEYNKVQGELAILLRNRDQLAAGLHQQMSAISQQQAQLRSQKLALEVPKLFEEIPDLANSEVRENLGKYVRGQGVSEEEFAYATFSVPFSKIAFKAYQYDKLMKEQSSAKAKLQQKVQALPNAAGPSSRSVDKAAQTKQLHSQWRKGGGSINDPAFSELLRARLRGK